MLYAVDSIAPNEHWTYTHSHGEKREEKKIKTN